MLQTDLAFISKAFGQGPQAQELRHPGCKMTTKLIAFLSLVWQAQEVLPDLRFTCLPPQCSLNCPSLSKTHFLYKYRSPHLPTTHLVTIQITMVLEKEIYYWSSILWPLQSWFGYLAFDVHLQWLQCPMITLSLFAIFTASFWQQRRRKLAGSWQPQ